MLQMKPAIAIGIGGTGKEGLILLRKKVVQHYGSLRDFSLLGQQLPFSAALTDSHHVSAERKTRRHSDPPPALGRG